MLPKSTPQSDSHQTTCLAAVRRRRSAMRAEKCRDFVVQSSKQTFLSLPVTMNCRSKRTCRMRRTRFSTSGGFSFSASSVVSTRASAPSRATYKSPERSRGETRHLCFWLRTFRERSGNDRLHRRVLREIPSKSYRRNADRRDALLRHFSIDFCILQFAAFRDRASDRRSDNSKPANQSILKPRLRSGAPHRVSPQCNQATLRRTCHCAKLRSAKKR